MVDWKLRKYTKEEFKDAWLSSNSIAECSIKLGLAKNGGTYKSLKSAANDLKLSTDHMKLIRDKKTNTSKIPLDKILIENSTYSTSDLRKRLISEGIFKERCSAPYCPNPELYPNPFTGEISKTRLTLDHINGNNTDNRLENLRVLCYNCHALTETFCSTSSSTISKTVCACGKQKDRSSMMCIECRDNKPTRLSSYEDSYLLNGVLTLGWKEFSRRLNISDNGLRKEIDRRGLERPTIPRGPRKVRPAGFEPAMEYYSAD